MMYTLIKQIAKHNRMTWIPDPPVQRLKPISCLIPAHPDWWLFTINHSN